MIALPQYNDIFKLLKNLNSEKYIDTTGYTVERFESECKNMYLDVTSKPRNKEKIEKRLNPPAFVVIFYYYIYKYKRIPSQEQFIDIYYKINSVWIHNNVSDDLNDAFLGRLSRTYPSLMRDMHFYFLLKESNEFNRIVYKLIYDLSGKVDVFVQNQNNNWYGVQLRLDTKNSNYFYNLKPFRNAFELDFLTSVIDLPLNLSGAYSVQTRNNDFKFYSQTQVNYLKNLITNFENNELTN